MDPGTQFTSSDNPQSFFETPRNNKPTATALGAASAEATRAASRARCQRGKKMPRADDRGAPIVPQRTERCLTTQPLQFRAGAAVRRSRDRAKRHVRCDGDVPRVDAQYLRTRSQI